jgi:hypothetical protein
MEPPTPALATRVLKEVAPAKLIPAYAPRFSERISAPQWIRNHQRSAAQSLSLRRNGRTRVSHEVPRTGAREAGEDRRSPRSTIWMPIASPRAPKAASENNGNRWAWKPNGNGELSKR